MQNYSARCNKCKTLLFEVTNFEAFRKPSPVIMTCRGGCGSRFSIRPAAGGGLNVTQYGNKKKKLEVLIAPSGEA